MAQSKKGHVSSASGSPIVGICELTGQGTVTWTFLWTLQPFRDALAVNIILKETKLL